MHLGPKVVVAQQDTADPPFVSFILETDPDQGAAEIDLLRQVAGMACQKIALQPVAELDRLRITETPEEPLPRRVGQDRPTLAEGIDRFQPVVDSPQQPPQIDLTLDRRDQGGTTLLPDTDAQVRLGIELAEIVESDKETDIADDRTVGRQRGQGTIHMSPIEVDADGGTDALRYQSRFSHTSPSVLRPIPGLPDTTVS